MSESDTKKPGLSGKQDADWVSAELEFGNDWADLPPPPPDDDEDAEATGEQASPGAGSIALGDLPDGALGDLPDVPVAPPDAFTEPTRQIEEFGGDTRPIKADELHEKLTESWVDSPEDDLEITFDADDGPNEVFASRLPNAAPAPPGVDAGPPGISVGADEVAPPQRMTTPKPLEPRQEQATADRLDVPTLQRLDCPTQSHFNPDGTGQQAAPTAGHDPSLILQPDEAASAPASVVRVGLGFETTTGDAGAPAPAGAPADNDEEEDLFANALDEAAPADSRLDSGLFADLDALKDPDALQPLDSGLFARFDPPARPPAQKVPPAEPTPREQEQTKEEDPHQRATVAHLTVERDEPREVASPEAASETFAGPLDFADDPRVDSDANTASALLADLPIDPPRPAPAPSPAAATSDVHERPTRPMERPEELNALLVAAAPAASPPAASGVGAEEVDSETPTLNALPVVARPAPRAKSVASLERTDAPAVAAEGRAPTAEPQAVQTRADQATPALPSDPLPPQFRPRRGGASPHIGVAIDFGTTRSSVAAVVDGRVRILPLPNGRFDILSCVGLRQDGAALIGDRAREMMAIDPRCVLPSPKRMLGRQYDDREIEPHIAQLAVPVLKGPNGRVTLNIRGRRYTVPQLCAPIMYHLKTVAEQHLGRPVDSVVLTSPTAFDDAKHRALAETAALAGLRVQSFVDEPAAAALANRQDRAFKGLVGVYDFGGGTFDFSVIDVASLQMITTAGDSWLGGDDFDDVIAGAAANAFWRDSGVEIRHQVVQWQRLLHAAEQAKRQLSVKADAEVHVQQAALTSRGSLDLRFRITRAQFAELARPLVERSMDTCQTALELSDIKVGELSAIYLSGGTSYIPAVQDAVARFFGKIPLIAVPPEQAVALGAACYAALPPARART